MVEADVNRDGPALRRWLGTITQKRMKYSYRTAFRAYDEDSDPWALGTQVLKKKQTR